MIWISVQRIYSLLLPPANRVNPLSSSLFLMCLAIMMNESSVSSPGHKDFSIVDTEFIVYAYYSYL